MLSIYFRLEDIRLPRTKAAPWAVASEQQHELEKPAWLPLQRPASRPRPYLQERVYRVLRGTRAIALEFALAVNH